MSALQTVKLWAVAETGLAKDALHIYVGLILFLVAAAVMRWPLRSWKPWAAVAAVTLIGEAWDMLDRARSGTSQYPPGNWKDLWNTLFWPTALSLIARFSGLLKR